MLSGNSKGEQKKKIIKSNRIEQHVEKITIFYTWSKLIFLLEDIFLL